MKRYIESKAISQLRATFLVNFTARVFTAQSLKETAQRLTRAHITWTMSSVTDRSILLLLLLLLISVCIYYTHFGLDYTKLAVKRPPNQSSPSA